MWTVLTAVWSVSYWVSQWKKISPNSNTTQYLQILQLPNASIVLTLFCPVHDCLNGCLIGIVLGVTMKKMSPNNNTTQYLTTPYFQVLPILLTAYTSFSLLPALLSTCSSVTEDTHCILPTCILQLYKNSFINRCLFEYIYLWFYVFLCLCVFCVCTFLVFSLLSLYFVCVCHTILKHIWFDLCWRVFPCWLIITEAH